ncbi:MAG: hypothetical protein ACQESJ_05500 [Bacteroidota bacterium]
MKKSAPKAKGQKRRSEGEAISVPCCELRVMRQKECFRFHVSGFKLDDDKIDGERTTERESEKTKNLNEEIRTKSQKPKAKSEGTRGRL